MLAEFPEHKSVETLSNTKCFKRVEIYLIYFKFYVMSLHFIYVLMIFHLMYVKRYLWAAMDKKKKKKKKKFNF